MRLARFLPGGEPGIVWSEIRVSARQGAGQATVDEGNADRNQPEAEKLPREQPFMQKQRAEDD